MQNQHFRRLIYKLKHQYATTSNAVVVVAFIVAISWAWGSVSVMERNYKLQHDVDDKNRQAKLIELENARLKYEQRYYQSDEYRELAVRQRLGLVAPGEHVIIVPENSPRAKQWDRQQQTRQSVQTVEERPSNLQQWLTFLMGGTRHDLQ